MNDRVVKLEELVFDPPEGLRDRNYSPTRPESEEAIRTQIQGVSDQLRDHVNAMAGALASSDAQLSGAHRIGVPEHDGISGENVAAQIADLKRQIDNTVAGSIPDASIGSSKLALSSVKTHHIAPGAVLDDNIGISLTRCDERLYLEDGVYTVPHTGMYELVVVGGGAGGRGGGNRTAAKNLSGTGGIGGTAGQVVTGIRYLCEGMIIPVTVGAGGLGGDPGEVSAGSGEYSGTAGQPGGTSSFGQIMSSTCSGYAGGSTTGINVQSYTYGSSGGGGGSLYSAGTPGSRSASQPSEGGTGSHGAGNGGRSGSSSNSALMNGEDGTDATYYGCGGGGGGGAAALAGAVGGRGGNGVQGFVIVRRINVE